MDFLFTVTQLRKVFEKIRQIIAKKLLKLFFINNDKKYKFHNNTVFPCKKLITIILLQLHKYQYIECYIQFKYALVFNQIMSFAEFIW